MTTITNILADHGFEIEHTGGGCSLLSLYLPHGAYVWISTLDGCDAPTWSDWLVCVYPADWDGAPATLLFDASSDDSLCGLSDAVAAALAAA
jgi:hypothetical protein